MKNIKLCNIAIVVIFTLFNRLYMRGIQIFPFEDMDNDELNPLNAFFNIDSMANNIMSKYQ